MRQDEVTDSRKLVGHIAEAVRQGTDAQLRADGGVMAPTVYMLAEDLDQPLLGYLTCRPFYRGADAVAAIAAMGELPSVLRATRLVVVWEVQDLNAAVGAAVDPDGAALVVLDVTFDQYTAHWYPLRLRPAPDWADSGAVIPEWGTPVEIADRTPPMPIGRLIDTWREWRDGDLNETVIRLETAGYRAQWMQR